MRFRLSAWLPALFAACCSNWALALGLGEIKLNSALNQPLNAEIELLQVRDLQPQEISVSLASSEEFERLGIDRPFFLGDLRFAVDLQAPGGPVVRVTSLKPVREPFVNFVVNARWPSGRLLREYTLLVDLPVFTGGRAQAPAAPVRSEPPRPAPRQSAPAPAPAPTRAPERRPEPSAPAVSAGADSYTVSANDSLWAIASQVRPARELSVQQTMLAIQRLNPEAFIDNNINRLRRGQVLRVPSAEEIEALTFQQAVRQVAEQNDAFQNRTASPQPAAPARPQLDASEAPSAAPTAPAAPEGRVKLSAPTDAAEGGRATGDGRSLDAIELELNQAQEQLDAASRESGELRSRVSTMEEQIDTMERLVEVSSEEMRNLELAARQLNEGVLTQSPDATTPEASTDTAESAAAVEASEPAVQPAPARPAPKRGLVDVLLDNLLWIGLGVLAVVGAVVAIVLLRKRNDDWDDDEFQAMEGDFTYDSPADPTQLATDMDPTEPALLATGEYSDAPLEQADALVAAGDYDGAAELLESELKVQPHNESLRLKALEVYAALGDHNRFDAHYAEALRRDDAALVERARLMRQGIADAPQFNPAYFGLGAAMVADAGEFELSDDTLQFDLPPDDVLDVESVDLSASELELELEAEGQLAPEPELVVTMPAATEAVDDDFDLNFEDIDLQLEGGAIPADSLADLDAELGGFDFDDLGEPETDAAASELTVGVEQSVIDESSIEGLDLDFSDMEETAAAPAPMAPALFDDNNEFDAALELDLSPELAPSEDVGSLAENFLGDEDLLLELDEEEAEGLSLLDADAGADQEELEIAGLDDQPVSSGTYDFIETDLTGLDDVIPESDLLKPDDDDVPARETAVGRAATIPFALPDVDPEADDDSQLGFLSDGDETATKLDLARAYLDMGDADGAKDILDEIMEEGDQDQRLEAQTLLAKLG